MRAFAEPYGYDPETDPLLKIPPEPQGQPEAQPELVYYQLDHLGTPIAAHNAKGEAVWTAEHEAWGRIRNETVSEGLKVHVLFSIMMKRTGCTTTVLLLQPKECWMKLKKTGDLTTRDLLRKGWGDINKKAV
ncbi:hypothetical protein A6J88_10090 [Neisseria mucosa]|uniref:RHS protein conserved region domain-containing protein n=1 Tax=Neisseria mucosa TaxID=488 RepID=A0ABM6JD07_NEIMU|nr:hypothetical protein A6J88_10090 [Neisseria mucosa]